MAVDGLAQESSRIQRVAVSRSYHANLSLRDNGDFGDRYAKQVRMDWPQTRRQCAQLNTFHAALLQKRNWILKIVMPVLRAIRSEDSSRRHGIAVDCFDQPEFI